MITLQEQFEKDFPDKGIEHIIANEKYQNSNFTNWDLDLRKYKDLEDLELVYNQLTSINLTQNSKLKRLFLHDNQLTSIDFLRVLPNPEKLKQLTIYDNKIQPTDIKIFSNFVNLEALKIGTTIDGLKEGKHNKFYGSLKSYQNLTKLEAICIEATDVNEGLEYLPESLLKSIKELEKRSEEEFSLIEKYDKIECSSHSTNAKCKAIQDQLRPFNYDLEAWQLANLDKIIKTRDEKLQNKEQLIKDLEKKIEETKQELTTTKTQEADKTAKISRLEQKLQLLQETKTNLENELKKEQQQHNQTKTNFQSQLRDLATILFPSNSDINNLSFANLKIQAEKIKEQNAKLQEKNQDQATQIQKLKLTKSTIHQQTQTDFPSQKKETQNEAKETANFCKNNSTPLTEEEEKWEVIKVGIEKETDLTRLANGDYWDIQIQNLPDNLLPANKQSIVLKNRRQQREQQLKNKERTEAKIEFPPYQK